MDPLAVRPQIINLTTYKEVERFATEAYNLRDYKFAAVEECGNDTDCAFHVTPDVDADDDEEDIKLIRGGHVPLYRNSLLLNLLCLDGVLPAGNYLVEVMW